MNNESQTIKANNRNKEAMERNAKQLISNRTPGYPTKLAQYLRLTSEEQYAEGESAAGRKIESSKNTRLTQRRKQKAPQNDRMAHALCHPIVRSALSKVDRKRNSEA